MLAQQETGQCPGARTAGISPNGHTVLRILPAHHGGVGSFAAHAPAACGVQVLRGRGQGRRRPVSGQCCCGPWLVVRRVVRRVPHQDQEVRWSTSEQAPAAGRCNGRTAPVIMP